MPDLNQIIHEIGDLSIDSLRRKYVKILSEKTGRNVIIYYSCWLQRQEASAKVMITDADMNAFMAAIHGMDKSKGLDLVLHTPGGEVNATEALVNYLRSYFGLNIRAFVPQLAMSAGTMIALSCQEIWMGKHSSIGPIDPQINGAAAHGIVEEWNRAKEEIAQTPVLINAWEPILRKYNPTLIGECEKAIKMADEIVRKWLIDGAVHHQKAAAGASEASMQLAVKKVLDELGEHKKTLNHGRHVSAKTGQGIGLNVKFFEDDPVLQDAVLSVHHVCTLTFARTNLCKIVENQHGRGLVMA